MDPLLVKLRRLAAAADAAQKMADDDREARDAVIEEAEVAGLSVRDITAAVAPFLSKSGVQRIIVARTAARQRRQASAIGL